MFITLRQTAAAAAVASISLASQAQSVIVDWGTHGPAEVAAQVKLLAGAFSDSYSFTIGAGQTLSSVVVSNNNPPLLEISSGSYSLFNNPDAVIGNGDDLSLGTWNFDGTSGQTVNSLALAGGSYYYLVNGNVSGSVGGVYTLTSAVTAVPEPQPYALLLGGLAALGFLIARRRSN